MNNELLDKIITTFAELTNVASMLKDRIVVLEAKVDTLQRSMSRLEGAGQGYNR